MRRKHDITFFPLISFDQTFLSERKVWLLDTSGLLCSLRSPTPSAYGCYHAGEPQHADAVTFFNAATARLTHSYVLAEFVVLCQSRGLNRTRVLNFSVDLLDNPHVEIVWVDEALHRSALTLLQERLDKVYSLCDAVPSLEGLGVGTSC
jgi:hypothetical protein